MNEINNSIIDEDVQKNKEKVEQYSSFFACFLFIGSLLIFYFTYSFILGVKTLHWKETKAKVQLYDVETKTTKTKTRGRSRSRSRSRTRTYTHVYGTLDYEYTVDGISYKNDKVSYLLSENKSIFRKMVLKGFVNPVSIKYDPNNPKNSVIYGFSFSKFWYLIFGVFMILISFIPLNFIKNNDNTFSIKDALIVNLKASMITFVIFIGIKIWLNNY